jgi:hypothetical protein
MGKDRKYECPHCDHSCVHQHFIKHLISKHLDVFQTKYTLEAKSACNHKKPMTLHAKNEHLFTCLGCNKFWARKSLADTHFEDCPNKKEHLEVCKSIFEKNNIECSSNADDSELVKQLQEHVKQLQEQVKKLKRQLENKEAEVMDCQEKVDAFDTLISCIYEKTDEDERDVWRDWLKSNKEDVEWEDYL